MLHRVVRDHLQTFLWELDRREHERGAPLFVKREFQRFVRCGVLAHGFARFRCTGCGNRSFGRVFLQGSSSARAAAAAG